MITAAASAVTKIHENKRGASFMSSNLNKTRKELPYDVRARPCGKAPHRESYQGQRSKNIYLKFIAQKEKLRITWNLGKIITKSALYTIQIK